MSQSEPYDVKKDPEDMNNQTNYGSIEQRNPETGTDACAQEQEINPDFTGEQPEGETVEGAEEPEVKMVRHRCRRWWTRVEPIIILYYVASASLGSIYQQYLYARVSIHQYG